MREEMDFSIIGLVIRFLGLHGLWYSVPMSHKNITVDRPLNSLDLVPTLGALLGFPTPHAQGKPIVEVV